MVAGEKIPEDALIARTNITTQYHVQNTSSSNTEKTRKRHRPPPTGNPIRFQKTWKHTGCTIQHQTSHHSGRKLPKQNFSAPAGLGKGI
eukprot:4972500-Karenia_brevis.AAC.1